MRYLIAIVTIGLLLSCNEDKEIDPLDLGYDYYPIELGQYRIYDVYEIIYKLDNDTSIYQLRETIFDSIVSNDQVDYLIRRDIRSTPQDPWKSDSVWTVTMNQNFLSIKENNIPFIKLSFPVEISSTWDGNGLNTKNTATYSYSVADSILVDSISLQNHVKVVISDIPENIVNRDERIEIYARGIGLVQKHYWTLEFCTASCEEFGEITSGRFLNQVLIEAGE